MCTRGCRIISAPFFLPHRVIVAVIVSLSVSVSVDVTVFVAESGHPVGDSIGVQSDLGARAHLCC